MAREDYLMRVPRHVVQALPGIPILPFPGGLLDVCAILLGVADLDQPWWRTNGSVATPTYMPTPGAGI